MAELKQRHVIELNAGHTAMVAALADRLGITRADVFRRAVEALYRETLGDKEAD